MRVLIALSGALVSGCAILQPPPQLSTEEILVSGAVLNHLLAGSYALPAPSSSQPIAVCLPHFVDPPRALVRPVGNRKIVPCSSVAGRNPSVPVQLSRTGEWAFKCSVVEVTKQAKGYAVRANCYSEPLSGSGYSYLVALVDGIWTVIEHTSEWTS